MVFGKSVPKPFRGLVLTCHTQPAIDIEAKVADGYLGVGVFAPEDMLSEGQVKGVMEDVRRLMMEFDEV